MTTHTEREKGQLVGDLSIPSATVILNGSAEDANESRLSRWIDFLAGKEEGVFSGAST